MPLLQFKDDAAKLAGGLPSRFEGIARPEAAVALALATALLRRGWVQTASSASTAADDISWPGTTSSVEWVFGFECPDRTNPFELHVSLQETTKRMLAHLREIVTLPGGGGGKARVIGASALMGVTASNFLRSTRNISSARLPTLDDEGIEPGTIDAEVVDAGHGDADDSWSGVLRNTGELETMVRALLVGPVVTSSAGRKGLSPGQKRKEARRNKVRFLAVGGVFVAAAAAAFAFGGGGGFKKEEDKKKKTTTKKK